MFQGLEKRLRSAIAGTRPRLCGSGNLGTTSTRVTNAGALCKMWSVVMPAICCGEEVRICVWAKTRAAPCGTPSRPFSDSWAINTRKTCFRTARWDEDSRARKTVYGPIPLGKRANESARMLCATGERRRQSNRRWPLPTQDLPRTRALAMGTHLLLCPRADGTALAGPIRPIHTIMLLGEGQCPRRIRQRDNRNVSPQHHAILFYRCRESEGHAPISSRQRVLMQ